MLSRLDAAELSAAGYAWLHPRMRSRSDVPVSLTPDGVPEREQPCATRAETVRTHRRAITVDGKCLRGACRVDGSRLSAESAGQMRRARSRAGDHCGFFGLADVAVADLDVLRGQVRREDGPLQLLTVFTWTSSPTEKRPAGEAVSGFHRK